MQNIVIMKKKIYLSKTFRICSDKYFVPKELTISSRNQQ